MRLLDGKTLLSHKHEQARQHTRRRQTKDMLKRRADEDKDSTGMQKSTPPLFVHPSDIAMLDFLLAVNRDQDLFFLGMHQALRMQRRLRQEAICWRDPEDTTQRGRRTQENDIPSKTARFLRPVPIYGADDTADFVIEEEEDGDDETRYDSRKDPPYWQIPELHEEYRAIWGARLE